MHSYILLGIGVVLFLVCIVLFIHIVSLKRELRNIKNELAATRDLSYNRQLTVSLFDNDLSSLTLEMNHNLDYQKQLKLETEQAEQQMKQSISDIAHDLRTPITVIKGNLQMLDKNEAVSEKNQSYLDTCLKHCDSLKSMVDDFFELSVLESDHTLVELKRVNVTNMLMQFLIDHEAVLRANGLEPEVQFPDKTIFILADEQMLLRMFSNLLNNIVKYAKNSFQVKMEIIQDAMCKITFANQIEHGLTIDIEHLFDRTYRGDAARHGSGAGLGLYIVKLLADKQGAEVQAVCEENLLQLYMMFKIN
jgi:signal transduction histidine kinase